MLLSRPMPMQEGAKHKQPTLGDTSYTKTGVPLCFLNRSRASILILLAGPPASHPKGFACEAKQEA